MKMKEETKMWLFIGVIVCWGIFLQIVIGSEHSFIIVGTLLIGIVSGWYLKSSIYEDSQKKKQKKGAEK